VKIQVKPVAALDFLVFLECDVVGTALSEIFDEDGEDRDVVQHTLHTTLTESDREVGVSKVFTVRL
jgi:hypothetical protein